MDCNWGRLEKLIFNVMQHFCITVGAFFSRDDEKYTTKWEELQMHFLFDLSKWGLRCQSSFRLLDYISSCVSVRKHLSFEQQQLPLSALSKQWAVAHQQMMLLSCFLPSEIHALEICLQLKWINFEMVLDFLRIFLGVVVKFLLLLQLPVYEWNNCFKKGGGGICISARDCFLLKVSFEQPVNQCHIEHLSGDLKVLYPLPKCYYCLCNKCELNCSVKSKSCTLKNIIVAQR